MIETILGLSFLGLLILASVPGAREMVRLSHARRDARRFLARVSASVNTKQEKGERP